MNAERIRIVVKTLDTNREKLDVAEESMLENEMRDVGYNMQKRDSLTAEFARLYKERASLLEEMWLTNAAALDSARNLIQQAEAVSAFSADSKFCLAGAGVMWLAEYDEAQAALNS